MLLTKELAADAEFVLVFHIVRHKVLAEAEAHVQGALELVHELALFAGLDLLLLLFNLFVTLLAYQDFGFAPATGSLGNHFLAVGRDQLDLGGIKFGMVGKAMT